MAQAIAVDDANQARSEADVDPEVVQARAGRGGQTAAGGGFAIAADEIQPPATIAEVAQAFQHRRVLADTVVGLDPVREEVAEQHEPGRWALGQQVEPPRERLAALAEVDIARHVQDRCVSHARG
jgi:hypothetical protein